MDSYARAVARLVMAAGATSVRIVDLPPEVPEKWDLADPLPRYWVDVQGFLEEAKVFVVPAWGVVDALPPNVVSATDANWPELALSPPQENRRHPPVLPLEVFGPWA